MIFIGKFLKEMWADTLHLWRHRNWIDFSPEAKGKRVCTLCNVNLSESRVVQAEIERKEGKS